MGNAFGIVMLKWKKIRAVLHGATFLATCNALLLLRDVNFATKKLFVFITYHGYFRVHTIE